MAVSYNLFKDARSRLAQDELYRALATIEPRLARAFKEATAVIRSSVSIRAITQSILAGDLDTAARLSGIAELGNLMVGIGIPPGNRSFLDGATEAFRLGGTAGMRQMPRESGLRANLDLTNPESVRYLRNTLPELIRNITNESRIAVNSAVIRGFEEGRPARLIAKEVREVVGLTDVGAKAVGNFRRQLETGSLGGGSAPWDRRLSASAQAQARSIFNGGGEKSERVDSLVNRYADSLITRRAKDIARTEGHRAFDQGQQELWRQAASRGLIDEDETRQYWIVTPDDRLREDHMAIPGMNAEGVRIGGLFLTPFGNVTGPSDPNPGLINCRCTVSLKFSGSSK